MFHELYNIDRYDLHFDALEVMDSLPNLDGYTDAEILEILHEMHSNEDSRSHNDNCHNNGTKG